MRIYLVVWPEGWGGVSNPAPDSLFLGGTEQWRILARLREKLMQQGEDLHLRLLISYWYYKDMDLDELFAKYFDPPYPDVFADSGGFTADSQGVTIAPEDYADWLYRYEHLLTAYMNLDVIGDQAGTWENQKRLEEMGVQPVPILTLGKHGADYDHLRMLVERYPYICLGGLVPYAGNMAKIMPHLIKCFQIAKGKAVFHGFGITTWRVLKSLPFYSVDSTSWKAGLRYGNVSIFDPQAGRLLTLDLGKPKQWQRHAGLIRAYGLDPQDFADRSRNEDHKVAGLAGISYMKAEQWLRHRHGIIRRSGSEQQGLRLYLAETKSTFGDVLSVIDCV